MATKPIERVEADLGRRFLAEIFIAVDELRGDKKLLNAALTLWKAGAIELREVENGSENGPLLFCVAGESGKLGEPGTVVPYGIPSIERLAEIVRGPQRGARLVGTDGEYRVIEDNETGKRRRVIVNGAGDWTDELGNKLSSLGGGGTKPLFPRVTERVM